MKSAVSCLKKVGIFSFNFPKKIPANLVAAFYKVFGFPGSERSITSNSTINSRILRSLTATTSSALEDSRTTEVAETGPTTAASTLSSSEDLSFGNKHA